MKILQDSLNINFMAKRKLTMIVSITLIVISLGSLVTRGLNFGIDFTGGYLIEVGYEEAANITDIRNLLAENGIEGAIVQHFGTQKDVAIRLAPDGEAADRTQAAKVSNNILSILQSKNAGVSKRRVEYVGPQIGDELKNDGGLAMIFALLAIMAYVMMRFEKRFSIGAVVALAHDVIITIGVFSILQANFDLTVLAAILAVIGYSLNDTIVVYDRIRENFARMRKAETIEITNFSINQTLSRTLVTSLTTLLVLLSLFIIGGETIHGFSLALIVGVVVGTYSSVFVASPIVLALGLRREDMLVEKKEDSELEQMP